MHVVNAKATTTGAPLLADFLLHGHRGAFHGKMPDVSRIPPRDKGQGHLNGPPAACQLGILRRREAFPHNSNGCPRIIIGGGLSIGFPVF
jgi:hypothetical protein